MRSVHQRHPIKRAEERVLRPTVRETRDATDTRMKDKERFFQRGGQFTRGGDKLRETRSAIIGPMRFCRTRRKADVEYPRAVRNGLE